MGVTLTDFWSHHPMEGDLSKAIQMVEYEIIEAKEKYASNDEEYKKELCDAYVMLEHILTEMGLHPSHYGY